MALGRGPRGAVSWFGPVGRAECPVIGLVLVLVAQAWPATAPAAAQAQTALLDSRVPRWHAAGSRRRHLDGAGSERRERRHGHRAGLHPEPAREVPLVRRTFVRRDPIEPSYSLVYLDLEPCREQSIIEGVGPQAIIAGPQIAPDGSRGSPASSVASVGRSSVLRSHLTGEKPKQGPARPGAPGAREVSLVTAGAYAPDGPYPDDGRVLHGRNPGPRPDPRGLYRVSADLATGTKVAAGIDGAPIGVGPSGAWVAILESVPASEDALRDHHRLVILDLAEWPASADARGGRDVAGRHWSGCARWRHRGGVPVRQRRSMATVRAAVPLHGCGE